MTKTSYTKTILRVLGAFLALWLSVVSFGTGVVIAVSAPVVQDDVFTQMEEPKWKQEFEAEIAQANTLDLSYNKNGYAAKLTSPKRKNVQQASAATAYKKVVLPKTVKIPSLNKTLKVESPQTTKISELNKGLKKAVLRYPGTATLEESNRNMIIFGHSSHLPTDMVFNQMYRAFNGIEKLKFGDKVIVVGADGKNYVYKVVSVKKDKAGNAKILVDTNKKMLTLITCDNFGAKEDRWIVSAEFVSSY